MKQEKIKVLLDSDICNEIDDQFAICYALSCPEKLDVLGITIEPFRVSWRRTLSVRDSLVESRNEAYRLINLFGIKHSQENPFVFMGCDGFISEGYDSTNPAVERIIQLAKANKQLYICCTGTLTNIAMALKTDPSIATSLKIVWCGTDNILLDEFKDSNYAKDKEAFNVVVKSGVDFTIFPISLARRFVTSTFEFSRNTVGNNVTKYLRSLLNQFIYNEENKGIKIVYDIGPVAYLLHPQIFAVKNLDAQLVVKDKSVAVPKGRKVTYVVEMPRSSIVWIDFLSAINTRKNLYLKSQVFFTSDTHFSLERKVRLKQVPFKTVEEMDKELINRWNSVVGTNDVVYHLGDFGDYNLVKKLNGKVILICGNYEKNDYKDFQKFRQRLKALGFFEVYEKGLSLDEKLLGERVFLTHKPSNHAKDCITLFGHVHTLKLVTEYGFNVCCTYHYFTPLSSSTVKRYLNFIHNFADEDVFV